MEIKYIAFDPGDSTGWATFDVKGDAISVGTLKGKEALYEFFKSLPRGLTIICEDFLLYANKAQAQIWSRLHTIRVIGSIELYANLSGASLHFQPTSIKPIAYRWAGIAAAKNHAQSHELDAYVHGVYWLQRNNIRKPQQARGK